MDAGQGIEGFDGAISAKGQHRAAGEEAAPGIAPACPLAPVQVGHLHVLRRVDGLHGGDHAQLGQARQVLGGEQLDVLDALPQTPCETFAFGPLIDIEDAPVGRVADGVDGRGQTGPGRRAHSLPEFVRVGRRYASDPGATLVRGQHLGGAGA